MLFEEREHTIIEQVGCRDGMLLRVKLDVCHSRVGIDERLLIDAADSFQRSDVESVL